MTHKSYIAGSIFYQDMVRIMWHKLNETGIVRTSDAWDLCRHKYSYTVCGIVFKEIMTDLIDEKKARRVGNGRYEILYQSALIKDGVPPAADEIAVEVRKRGPVGPFFSKVYNQYLND